MNTLYLDCFSGISGDMFLAALLDIGLPEPYLRDILATLHLHDNHLKIARTVVQGFAATQVTVEEGTHLHGGQHELAGHGEHQNEHHEHRNLAEISQLLHQAALPDTIRTRAVAVFTQLAQAEAAVHGTTVDRIHFHEVGATDALIDIVGTVAGLDFLKIDRVVCSPLPLARGWVRCAHGEIPLPGPAVCRLLDGVPVYGEDLEMELVTPTGAALVRALADDFGPMPPMRLTRTGYGAGAHERPDGRPNLLRLLLGQDELLREAQEVEVIETHLDDWNPEFWPHLSTRLMALGALDVCLIPIQMKKGRAGFLLRVIGEAANRPLLTQALFTETSSIGLRWRRETRMTLPRETVMVRTPWGELAAKKITRPDGISISPEYEVCRKVAEEHQVALQEVYAAVVRAGEI
jgi:uncharacterized protein (TIGR00299 family) protein